jgi:Domain of unknown function (DUF1707)
VTAGSSGEPAATQAGRGQFRASHADRDQAVDVIKSAFVQGLLTKSELDARVGQAFTSRTYAELAALTTDLPAGLPGAHPPDKPAQAQHPQNKVVNSCAGAMLGVIALDAALVIGSFGWFLVVLAVILGTLLIAVRCWRRRPESRTAAATSSPSRPSSTP